MSEKLFRFLAMLLPPERVIAFVFALLDQAKKLADRTDNDLDNQLLDMIIGALHQMLDSPAGGE